MANRSASKEKFVKFIFPRDIGGPSKLEVHAIPEFDVLSVNVPKDAIGFSFVEADHINNVNSKNKSQVARYYFGSADDVVTTSELKKSDDIIDKMFGEQMEDFGCLRVLRFMGRLGCLGLTEKDIVIDRNTREITVPAPADKLGL